MNKRDRFLRVGPRLMAVILMASGLGACAAANATDTTECVTSASMGGLDHDAMRRQRALERW